MMVESSLTHPHSPGGYCSIDYYSSIWNNNIPGQYKLMRMDISSHPPAAKRAKLTSSPPSPSPSPSIDPYRSLYQWLRSSALTSLSHLSPCTGKYGLGLAATSSIPPSTPFLSMPIEYVLSWDTLQSHPFGKALIAYREERRKREREREGQKYVDIYDKALFYTFLAYCYGSPSSSHYRYLRAIPSPSSIHHMPISWDIEGQQREEYNALKGTNLWEAIPFKQKELKQQYSLIWPQIKHSYPQFFINKQQGKKGKGEVASGNGGDRGDIEYNTFVWAYCILHSRGFPRALLSSPPSSPSSVPIYPMTSTSPSSSSTSSASHLLEPNDSNKPVGCLIPLIDYCNHLPHSSASFSRIGDNIEFRYRDDQEYPLIEKEKDCEGEGEGEGRGRGKELFINYGDKSNEEFFFAYGFTLPHNKADDLAVQLTKQSLSSPAHSLLFNSLSLSIYFYLSKHSLSSPLLTALCVLTAPPSLLQGDCVQSFRWKEKGEGEGEGDEEQRIIDPLHEEIALHSLQRLLYSQLNKLSLSSGEEAEMEAERDYLAAEKEGVGENRRNVLIYRGGQKEILSKQIKYLKEDRNRVYNKGKDKQRDRYIMLNTGKNKQNDEENENKKAMEEYILSVFDRDHCVYLPSLFLSSVPSSVSTVHIPSSLFLSAEYVLSLPSFSPLAELIGGLDACSLLSLFICHLTANPSHYPQLAHFIPALRSSSSSHSTPFWCLSPSSFSLLDSNSVISFYSMDKLASLHSLHSQLFPSLWEEYPHLYQQHVFQWDRFLLATEITESRLIQINNEEMDGGMEEGILLCMWEQSRSEGIGTVERTERDGNTQQIMISMREGDREGVGEDVDIVFFNPQTNRMEDLLNKGRLIKGEHSILTDKLISVLVAVMNHHNERGEHKEGEKEILFRMSPENMNVYLQWIEMNLGIKIRNKNKIEEEEEGEEEDYSLDSRMISFHSSIKNRFIYYIIQLLTLDANSLFPNAIEEKEGEGKEGVSVPSLKKLLTNEMKIFVAGIYSEIIEILINEHKQLIERVEMTIEDCRTDGEDVKRVRDLDFIHQYHWNAVDVLNSQIN